MYTEIIKIIEGGLKKDTKKLVAYATLLAENLIKDGQKKLGERILKLVDSSKVENSDLVSLNELVSTPVDQESRLSIVDISYPNEFSEKLIISQQIKSGLHTFIESLKHRDKLQKVGLETNNSLLLYGPPGCGKTSIAKHISYQTGLPLVIARLDTIVSSLLGSTAKNIRRIFEFADSKPCILFLDEFDAIAKARNDQHEMGELKRVINSLLQNIDSYTRNNILIAATNHEELLDRAIWRRFNNIIEVGKFKDDQDIEKLVKLYSQDFENDFINDKKKTDIIINLFKEFSPSDIKTIINNAISKKVVEDKKTLDIEGLLESIFNFNKRGNNDLSDLVKFFNENHVAQTAIADSLNMSLRQVKNILNK